MVVAVAFSCVCAGPVAVRGIVFCPRSKFSLLSARLGTSEQQPVYRRALEKRGTGRDWVQEHFDFIDPTPARIEFPAPAFKRYFAFARVDDVLIRDQGLGIGFDVFVGPGELALSRNDGNEARQAARAIHGFANVSHNASFNDLIAQGQRYTLSGNAALCLVERPDELLSSDWGVRRDGVFEVVPKDEVRAVLLVQPPHRGHGSVRADTAISHKVGNTLERGFIFRAGLVVDFPEVKDKKVVGL
jgi:hypothetical protein